MVQQNSTPENKLLSELIGSLKLGNVWVFVQLIVGPRWPKNQLEKTQTFHNLRLLISSGDYVCHF